MLDIKVTGTKVIINGLNALPKKIRETAAPAALKQMAIGTFGLSSNYLSGGSTSAGSYPVPVRSGKLKRLLSALEPGRTKNGFITGPLQSMVFNSAPYSQTIHEGTDTSKKYGPRRYLTDALNRFNASGSIDMILEDETQKALNTSWL